MTRKRRYRAFLAARQSNSLRIPLLLLLLVDMFRAALSAAGASGAAFATVAGVRASADAAGGSVPMVAPSAPTAPPTKAPRLGAVLADSVGFAFGGRSVTLTSSANESADVGVIAADKREAYGTSLQRWSTRTERATITSLVQLGCSCGCVDKHARMEDILAMREQHKKESGKERREYMRTEGAVPDASKKLGFTLHWGDATMPACVTGFALRHGFEPNWVYRIMRDLKVRTCARLGGGTITRASNMLVAPCACRARAPPYCTSAEQTLTPRARDSRGTIPRHHNPRNAPLNPSARPAVPESTMNEHAISSPTPPSCPARAARAPCCTARPPNKP